MISVRNLTVTYNTREGKVKALSDLSFDIDDNIIFGIVGESGSGKSTLAMTIMGLLPKNSKVEQGIIEIDGENILEYTPERYRKLRGMEVSLVFQGAMNTLNPLIKIEEQVAETLILHRIMKQDEALKKARETLDLVGLDEHTWKKYPHELSGGMKQRAVIATAIASSPKVIIADEPSTALDVITQVQIMNLLRKLQKELGVTIILISHDFPLVSEMADRILILYGGKASELGSNSNILDQPKHPYTVGLINSVPTLSEEKDLVAIKGEPVNLKEPPSGCRFRPRCDFATPACDHYDYEVSEVEKGHFVFCNLYGDNIGSSKD
jgi:peptide/nickel transport system ATP-binding protein